MKSIHFLAVAALVAGCGSSNSVSTSYKGRTAENTPSRFDTDSNFARIAPADTLPGSGCLSPLHDPRDNTKLVMRRADKGVGDYEVPDGKYGVRNGELLRINCNTGETLGIVRR